MNNKDLDDQSRKELEGAQEQMFKFVPDLLEAVYSNDNLRAAHVKLMNDLIFHAAIHPENITNAELYFKIADLTEVEVQGMYDGKDISQLFVQHMLDLRLSAHDAYVVIQDSQGHAPEAQQDQTENISEESRTILLDSGIPFDLLYDYPAIGQNQYNLIQSILKRNTLLEGNLPADTALREAMTLTDPEAGELLKNPKWGSTFRRGILAGQLTARKAYEQSIAPEHRYAELAASPSTNTSDTEEVSVRSRRPLTLRRGRSRSPKNREEDGKKPAAKRRSPSP